MRNRLLVLLVAGLFTLAGCGGGGGNVRPEQPPPVMPEPDTDDDEEQEEEQEQDEEEEREPELPPPPPPARFTDEAARLLGLSDTVIRAQAGPCGTDGECLAFVLGGLIETHPLRGDTTLDEFDIGDTPYEPVTSRGNVSLANGRRSGRTFGATAYGGWMSHSFFNVHVSTITTRDITISRSWFPDAYSVGDASGSNPSPIAGGATWTGAMAGIDISDSPLLGNRVSGDATIGIADLTSPQVDVMFTGIRDEDAGTTRADMVWNDLAVRNGVFSGVRLRGQFYGPNHEEVGGVFKRNDIIGAFGASR